MAARFRKTCSPFQQKIHKPLHVAGSRLVQPGATRPTSRGITRKLDAMPLDLDLQRKLYEGFFRSWYGVTGFGGFMIWEWTAQRRRPEDRGYTPKGKPAEEVLREWLAKPRWKVTVGAAVAIGNCNCD